MDRHLQGRAGHCTSDLRNSPGSYAPRRIYCKHKLILSSESFVVDAVNCRLTHWKESRRCQKTTRMIFILVVFCSVPAFGSTWRSRQGKRRITTRFLDRTQRYGDIQWWKTSRRPAGGGRAGGQLQVRSPFTAFIVAMSQCISLVPKILRPYHPPISVKGAAEPRPSQVNPMILEQPLPHRPQASFPLLAYQTTTPAHGMAGSHAGAEEIVDAEDTATRLKVKIEPSTARVPSKSHRRSSRVKSNEWVDSDEDSEDMEPVREPSRKGKGKQRAASDDDEMDVDEPVEQEKGRGRGSRRLLAVSTESKTRRGHVMVKRSESRPPTDDGAQEDSHDDAVPASVPCTLCTRRRKECLFMPGKFACVACRKGKSKCSGVPESWRDRLKAQEPLQEPEVRSRSRQRSTSRPPKSKKAQPPPRSRPEAQKRTEDTDAEPAVGGSTAVVVKKGKKVRPTKPHPIQPLGQVPSQYVYLLSRQGEAVSKGIRVETDHIGLDGEGKVGSELHERVKKLEEENAGLRENITKQAIEVEQLKTMVGIVMATLNGHTALLEGQRIVLKELEEHGMKLDNAGDTEGSTFGAIPIPPPSTPLSKARPLQYPSSSLFQGRTSPTHPVKDPAVYWNSGISPSSSLVQEFVETSAYPAGVALSPALSNRPHSPRVEIEDEPMAESPE